MGIGKVLLGALKSYKGKVKPLNVEKIRTDKLDDIFSAAKKVRTPKVHNSYSEILAMQKPGTIKANSVPTQQYLDDMLGVAKTQRVSEVVANDGIGFVDPKKVADAKYAFTNSTKVEPVLTESIKTRDWIRGKFDFKTADHMARYEAGGTSKLPKKIEQAREDAYYAFTGQELKPSLLKRLNPLYLMRHQKHLDNMTNNYAKKSINNYAKKSVKFGLEL